MPDDGMTCNFKEGLENLVNWWGAFDTVGSPDLGMRWDGMGWDGMVGPLRRYACVKRGGG